MLVGAGRRPGVPREHERTPERAARSCPKRPGAVPGSFAEPPVRGPTVDGRLAGSAARRVATCEDDAARRDDGGGTALTRYPPERQRAITDFLLGQEDRRATVTQISEHLEVTTETVRRDLDTLERRGLLRRIRGGAQLLDAVPFEVALAARHAEQLEDKRRIAGPAHRRAARGRRARARLRLADPVHRRRRSRGTPC